MKYNHVVNSIENFAEFDSAKCPVLRDPCPSDGDPRVTDAEIDRAIITEFMKPYYSEINSISLEN